MSTRYEQTVANAIDAAADKIKALNRARNSISALLHAATLIPSVAYVETVVKADYVGLKSTDRESIIIDPYDEDGIKVALVVLAKHAGDKVNSNPGALGRIAELFTPIAGNTVVQHINDGHISGYHINIYF